MAEQEMSGVRELSLGDVHRDCPVEDGLMSMGLSSGDCPQLSWISTYIILSPRLIFLLHMLKIVPPQVFHTISNQVI